MADNKAIDFTLKVMILGGTEIGKTCFINRYTNNSFGINYITTIGIDFQIKHIEINEKKIKLQIWDTAGQECFRSITKNYFRNSHGFILAYDITNRRSFESITDWIKQIREYKDCNCDIVIIATKCDLEDDRIVSTKEGEQLAKENSMKFFETSAKENINVFETFDHITQKIFYSIENGDIPERSSIVINKNGKPDSKKKCC